MMLRIIFVIFATLVLAPKYSSAEQVIVASNLPTDAEINNAEREINNPEKDPKTDDGPIMPLISINTDNPLDMNWTSALELSGTTSTTPTEQIVLPFLPKYPINNLEIKLRVLDIKF